MESKNKIDGRNSAASMVNIYTKGIIVLIISLFFLSVKAQGYDKSGKIDIFVGMDFNCRDIYYNNRVYDVLVNLTPGVRWNMGNRWDAAVQFYIPVINQYGDYYFTFIS